MKRFLLLLSFATMFFAQQVQGQQYALSLDSSAYASVITCGPGNELYTTFGHSAIRICDSTQGIDLVYNYGTFDFDTPHFYWKFACGNLKYCLDRSSFVHFMSVYQREGRAVWQQRLSLSYQELNNLLVLLETNYLPQYRYYTYDFFRDNCATRVRDVVNNTLSHRTLFEPVEVPDAKSYRQLLHDATDINMLWWQTGIDMLLGMRCDHHCNNMEYMFSPMELMRQLDTTCIKGTNMALASTPELLLPELRQAPSPSFSPTLAFWALFVVVLVLSLLAYRYAWRLTWLDVTLYLLASAASLLIIFLWAFSSHYCTALNLNVLWASPLFLFFTVRPSSSPRWLYVLQLVLLLLAVFIGIVGWPQHFASAVIPIALTLAVRLFSQLRSR
ncbi:MAG: DUF4105 domain-containing protein [Bacteroidales bacterium]|nr:DUF4105 domain-containing protein [Bacteroidales bacterium]